MVYRLTLIVFLALFALFAPHDSFAQKSSWHKIRKADKLRLYGKIDGAIKKYESILTEDPTNVAANYQLGKIQLLDLEDFGKAEKYLSTAIRNFDEKDSIYMAYYYIAETQKLLGNFPQAIENYNFFKNYGIKNSSKSKSLIEDVNTKIDECKLGEVYVSDSKYTFTRVINLGEQINSDLSEYCSIFFPDNGELMYTARYQDNPKEKRFKDFKFYEGGYSLIDTNKRIKQPKALEINEKEREHFSVVSRTISGDSVVFFKNNKLWLSVKQDGELSNPIVLPEQINRSYYQPHGVFSPDNKTFVFSSADKKLKLNLYEVRLNDNNSWTEAKLLSKNINSKYNEDSPFFSKDGKTLYFSSNRPGGYGNYDIYFSKYIEGNWTEPINMGMPINSSGEDIFFSLNDDNKTGFLSSNRGGGYGAMDIYMFTEQPYPSFDCEEYFAENGNLGLNDILIMDELVVGENVRFDVTNAKIKDAKVSNIFWKVDETILKLDSPLLTYAFNDTGLHKVTTQIYGKHKKTDDYMMDCSSLEFNVLSEGPIFLEVVADRMVKVDTNSIIDASMLYFGESKKVSKFKWYVDGDKIDQNKQSYNYSFTDTGYHTIKVIASIIDDVNNEKYDITSSKKVFVYNDSHNVQFASNGDAYIPGIDLYDNTNPNNGKISALKADVYGIPDNRRVFYSWYIDNAEIKGRQTDLLTYDFQPLSTVTVKAFVMHEAEEPEFTLEATKVIPEYEIPSEPNVIVDQSDSLIVVGNPTTLNNDTTSASTNIGSVVDNDTVKVNDKILAKNNDNKNNTKVPDSKIDKDVTGKNSSFKDDISPVYFPFDKFYLTQAAKKIMDENVRVLISNPSLNIVIEGNTDSMGPSAYNLKLSEKRAKEVYKYLISNGVSADQIKGINSNGENLPKAPNKLKNGRDNPSGRRENRRVDFTIVEN